MSARSLLTLFDAVYLVAMAAWVGGLMFSSFVVAPTLARAVGPEAAARLARALAPRGHAWGATAGALALAARVCGALSVPEYRGPATAAQALLLLAGTLAMLHGGNALAPALAAAEAAAGAEGPGRSLRLRRQASWLDG
ncbi:MAG TPA: DUF4149 domain-containing protein, partial [Isosphaeraceae bacterium]